MTNDIPSQVIAFYQDRVPDHIVVTALTTFEEMQIEGEDKVVSIMELEESFNIPPDPHDAKNMYIVGDAIALIERKI